jgi:sodium transport system ATP-binding protein
MKVTIGFPAFGLTPEPGIHESALPERSLKMIVAKDLSKTFRLSRKQRREEGIPRSVNEIRAVDGVSFRCSPGRIFTLLGPNGAGKTTILRMVATLLRPTSGSITVEGFDTVADPGEVRSRIGFLTGTTRLYDRLTVTELIKYYADLHGLEKEVFKQRLEELYDLLGMRDYANRRIGKLSSGMKQKVSIARTVIHDPQVMIFDEPTTGLDVMTSRSIIDLIHRCTERGRTVIFSTHIMSEVSRISDDLAILHRGRLLFSDTYQVFREGMKEDSVEEEFLRVLKEGEKLWA